MRALFSEQTKRRMWRRLWLALAQAQSGAGLVNAEELADLRRHVDDIDIEAAHKIEAEISHDLMAELRVYASQARVGGGKLHLGATSMDIEDNVDIARMKVALSMLAGSLSEILTTFAEKIEQHADEVCMAYTHLQAAEPTTLGLRLALWAQDFLLAHEDLKRVAAWLPAKGLRGAVGTSASYDMLLRDTAQTSDGLEREVMDAFGLRALPVSGQTYARSVDYRVLASLAGFASAAAKFALDVRVLASSPFGELGEPFGRQQVGSSAMPFKRNPILCERIDSLARLLPANAQIAWQNAADNMLERTLDDSANRRSVIPESFLAADEIGALVHKVIAGLRVDHRRIALNVERFGPFAATEPVLMAAGKRGADRQKLHERLRDLSMEAWSAMEEGRPNPLADLLARDDAVGASLGVEELAELMDPRRHTGLAAERARRFAASLKDFVGSAPPAAIMDIPLR
ncbi:MAG: adenylosuccinate lyase [Candidatus Eremiobacter antarcticus]|nr:MAG: adenylosuccinate lyase [Candidatus Eremiobacter sp. RRmetagenome_bin22]